MRIIRARADDWVPSNPRIRLGNWIGAFVIVAVIYVAVAASGARSGPAVRCGGHPGPWQSPCPTRGCGPHDD